MPAGFTFHEKADLWVRAPRDIPDLGLDGEGDPATARDLSYMRAVGRLKDGVSLERAQADMDGIARQLAEQFPKTHAKRSVLVVPLRKEVVGDVDKALIALLGAVSLVLLIACTNVANLFFARATDRQREVTVRIALGASRRRLLQQLLTESVLLAVAAGVLGLGFGWALTKIMVSLSPGNIPRLDEIRLDGWVLAFTMAVSVVTGLLCGLLPLLQIRRVDLAAALKAGGVKATDSLVRQRLRSSLVVAEVALAVVLLLGAGLMIKSFANLRQIEPGFKPDRLLTFRISLPENRYQELPQQAAFVSQLLDRIKAQPGVVNASSVLTLPLGGDSINIPFVIEGKPRPEGAAESRDGFQAVSAGYFETMRIPLLKGRAFEATDNKESGRVVVLSQEMVRRYWGDEDPIGDRITFGESSNANSKWYTVVGVVADVRHEGPSSPPRAETYVPFAQWTWPFTSFAVRTSGDPQTLVTPIRRVVQDLDPALPITAVYTMDELLSGSISRPRFTSFLLGIFASMALLLSAIGLYGVMAYAVTQRTPEIGIRMALGAQKGMVMGDVLRRGVLLTLAGIVLGLALALPLSGLVKALLFGVAVTDRSTLVVVPLVLLCTALLATLVPAWKASRIDPLKAIRWE
jgi:putative ABC transport system permease protein